MNNRNFQKLENSASKPSKYWKIIIDDSGFDAELNRRIRELLETRAEERPVAEAVREMQDRFPQ